MINIWESVFVVFQHLCQISCLESLWGFQPKTFEQTYSLAKWGTSTWLNCSSPSKGFINISRSLTAYSFKAYLLVIYFYPLILYTGKHLLYRDSLNAIHTILNCISIHEDSVPKIFNHSLIPHLAWSYWKMLPLGFFLHPPGNHWLYYTRSLSRSSWGYSIELLKKQCGKEPIVLSWKTKPSGE